MLGNPVPEYAATRHNAGWRFADALISHLDAPPPTRVRLGMWRRAKALWTKVTAGSVHICILKPMGYMNRSGTPTARVLRHLRLELDSLLVVVDDIHLAVGEARLRPGGGAGGHKGLASIRDSLGSEDFGRLRLGIGAPTDASDLSGWVLAPADPEERRLEAAAMPRNLAVALAWAKEGMEAEKTVLARGR